MNLLNETETEDSNQALFNEVEALLSETEPLTTSLSLNNPLLPSLEESISNLTTLTNPSSIPSSTSSTNKKRISSEEPILIADTSLTCIDLTENDDQCGDIIIEKHVGSNTRNTRNLYYRNRYGVMQRRKNPSRELNNSNDQADATIIIDDERSPSNSKSSKKFDRISPPKRIKVNIEKPEKPEVQCPICLETLDELKKNNKRLKSTLCGHILCNECLDATFHASKTKTMSCPTCRVKLTRQKIHDLYI